MQPQASECMGRAFGFREIAANITAFSAAEAEHQWFHLPGAPAPRASRRLLSVAPRLLPGYDAKIALASARRDETDRRIRLRQGVGGAGDGFEEITITEAAMGIVPVGPPKQKRPLAAA
jgi:hypothetical protein